MRRRTILREINRGRPAPMGHLGNVKYKNRNRVENVYPNAERGGWALRSPGELFLPPDDVTKFSGLFKFVSNVGGNSVD